MGKRSPLHEVTGEHNMKKNGTISEMTVSVAH